MSDCITTLVGHTSLTAALRYTPISWLAKVEWLKIWSNYIKLCQQIFGKPNCDPNLMYICLIDDTNGTPPKKNIKQWGKNNCSCWFSKIFKDHRHEDNIEYRNHRPRHPLASPHPRNPRWNRGAPRPWSGKPWSGSSASSCTQWLMKFWSVVNIPLFIGFNMFQPSKSSKVVRVSQPSTVCRRICRIERCGNLPETTIYSFDGWSLVDYTVYI